MKRHLISTLTLIIGLSATTALADKKDIVETVVGAGDFKTLAAALDAAGLVETLQSEGPFTVFAPTDAAFAKLPEGTVESLLKPENKDQLIDILTYHVVAGNVPSTVAVGLTEATALNERTINVTKRDGGLFLNASKVVQTDIACSNGVIHVIDAVLLPPEPVSKQAMKARQLIHLAIEKGAPLYNHGQHSACAAIYEVTAHALMAMPESAMSNAQRDMVEHAISRAKHSHNMTTNAWVYREAFDKMMMSAQ